MLLDCYYWTDSAIVHCWVKNKGKSNPADIATRGLTPHYLANSEMWFYGPDFLKSELKQLEHVDVMLNPDTNSEGLENYIRSTNSLFVLQVVKSDICLTDSYDIVKTVSYDTVDDKLRECMFRFSPCENKVIR